MLPAKVVDRHHRARYSALTSAEVKAAFAKPSTLDFGLAEAAHSRQDIDLIWGAVLTRFISLASHRYGAEFLSVGRVQTPTLRLVVDRELQRRAFVPVPYWEIKATLERDGETVEVAHAKGRFDSEADAQAALARASADEAVVTGYEAKPRKLPPPTPFNTTALMSAAAAVGVSPSRAMRAAESLYLDGLISYPRTDNTVYPPSLDLGGICAALGRHEPVADVARELAAAPRLKPTGGKRRTTDHPPMYPVDVPKTALSGDREKVYDLVVRRFLATLMPAADHRGSAPRRAHRHGAVPGAWQPRGRRPASCVSTRSTPRSATGPGALQRRATCSGCSTCTARARRRSRRSATARATSSRRWRSWAWAPRPRAPTSSSTCTTVTTCATTRSSPPSWASPSSARSTSPCARRPSTSRRPR